MATTIRTKIVTATVAAAVAFTGFAPAANAGVLDIFSNGLSISAGGQAEYDTTPVSHTTRTTTAPTNTDNSPMAADYRANQAEGRSTDILGRDYSLSQDVWKNKVYRAKSLEMARLINRHRAAQGEGPMRLDPSMSEAAQAWSESMAESHWFEHDPGNKKLGEIIAMRYNIEDPDVSEKFIEQWENSPAHDKLLHDPDFTAMGVGMAASNDGSGEVYATVRLYYR